MTFEQLISENKTIVIICTTNRDVQFQINNLVAQKKELIYKVFRVSNMVEMKNGTVITFIPERSYQKLMGISNDTPMFYSVYFQPLVDGFDEDLVRVRRGYYEGL